MLKNPTRPLVALICPALVLAVLCFTALELLVENSTSEELARALPWSAGNAAVWRRVASANALSLANQDLQKSADYYRQALAHNPLDSQAWEGLATVESLLGGNQQGEAALRGWTAAIPNSPRAAWALANLLLRQGRVEEALPYFRRAAQHDVALRPTLYPLAWNMLDNPDRILNEVIPEDEQGRVDYFRYLVDDRSDLSAAEPVWQSLRSMNSPRSAELGYLLAERFAMAGKGGDADRVWRLTAPQSATTQPGGKGERIINGDFERSLINAGLDWRTSEYPSFQISLDDFTSSSASRSLRVDFLGTGNPEFGEVFQRVVVEPNRDYHFRASIKTENLATDTGVYWSLWTYPPATPKEWETEKQIGSNPWTVQELDLRTPSNATVLMLQLRLRASKKPDALVRGTVWVDALSLTPR